MADRPLSGLDFGELLLTKQAVVAGGSDDLEVLRQLDSAAARWRQDIATGVERDEPFWRIVYHAQLDPAAAEVFAVLAAVELRRDLQSLVRVIDGDTDGRLTIEGLGRCAGGLAAAVDALEPGGRLQRACLIELDAAGPWSSRAVGLPTAVAWALVGGDGSEPDLPRRTFMIDGDRPWDRQPGLLTVAGADAATRHAAASAAFSGGPLLVTTCPADDKEWRAVVRRATIDGRVVVLELDADVPDAVGWWVASADHLGWVLSSAVPLALDRIPRLPIRDIVLAREEATADLWRATVGEPASYRLTPEQLGLVARVLPSVGGDVAAAVARLSSGHLDAMATCVHPRRQWDDLVVSPPRKRVLHAIVEHRRHRRMLFQDWGFDRVSAEGLVALFVGPPGTGKTLAAEVIAGALGLDLYVLNISAVVSKFLGETEKNLEAVFEAASAGDAVLFFDEADALFGKRTTVNDSHDRYANVETSYLLQRLERHDGLVLLASNLRQNIDEAFARRIRFIVEFELPDEDARRSIWELSIPKAAPCEELDLAELAARYEVSGATIRNAVLHAAVDAAAAGDAISMQGLTDGLRREYSNMGRMFRPEPPR